MPKKQSGYLISLLTKSTTFVVKYYTFSNFVRSAQLSVDILFTVDLDSSRDMFCYEVFKFFLFISGSLSITTVASAIVTSAIEANWYD